jgi:uncharacterized protein
MIRKLYENDHEQVMAYLSDEPSLNLFIIGDIEAYGYQSDFQELWAEFNDHQQIKAVLLRFYLSFVFYTKSEFDIEGFTKIMKRTNGPIILSGKADIVKKFENIKGLTLGNKKVMYFAECRSSELMDSTSIEVKQANIDDVERIIALRKTINEFHVMENAAEVLRKSMETHTGRTYYTEDNGLMTACVSTTAENSLSAMVVGVCTKMEYRRKGLATAIMQILFREILNEGKILCLFYDNPEAGRIYKKLGFVDIGMWTMHR